MKYTVYAPRDVLKPFVKAFAVQEAAAESHYTVLPDTGLVMGFQYTGRLSRIHNQTETSLSISGISGLADHYKVFKNTVNTGTVLVFFADGGAAPFFKQPLHELFRESVSLDNFMLRSALLCVEEKLAEAKTDLERVSVVEDFLIGRINHFEPDNLVAAALALIHRAKGSIRIRDVAAQLLISQSQLEKRFRRTVGASPKKFCTIVRLKNVIGQYNATTSLAALGYDAGFYDQAHFIKEFKTFTGTTPEKFFSTKS